MQEDRKKLSFCSNYALMRAAKVPCTKKCSTFHGIYHEDLHTFLCVRPSASLPLICSMGKRSHNLSISAFSRKGIDNTLLQVKM